MTPVWRGVAQTAWGSPDAAPPTLGEGEGDQLWSTLLTRVQSEMRLLLVRGIYPGGITITFLAHGVNKPNFHHKDKPFTYKLPSCKARCCSSPSKPPPSRTTCEPALVSRGTPSFPILAFFGRYTVIVVGGVRGRGKWV